jgi:hypothetical protein
MQIRRITTAEIDAGVATQVDDLTETGTRKVFDSMNIWGFDSIPNLPLGPEDVFGEYQDLGMFGPPGSLRADLLIIPPERGDVPADLGETASKINLGTGGGMIEGKEGFGMHRTDTIDWLIVLEGSANVAYPDGHGGEHEITLQVGDFLTHNGTFHRWHNRSAHTCTLLCVTFPAVREDTSA